MPASGVCACTIQVLITSVSRVCTARECTIYVYSVPTPHISDIRPQSPTAMLRPMYPFSQKVVGTSSGTAVDPPSTEKKNTSRLSLGHATGDRRHTHDAHHIASVIDGAQVNSWTSGKEVRGREASTAQRIHTYTAQYSISVGRNDL